MSIFITFQSGRTETDERNKHSGDIFSGSDLQFPDLNFSKLPCCSSVKDDASTCVNTWSDNVWKLITESSFHVPLWASVEKRYLTKRHSTADPWSRTKLTRKPERWKKKANENKAKHFSTSERASRAANVDLSWWLLMEETFPSSVSATAGPRRFISGWVTVKSRGSVMASAAVGLFGSEACVQFTQCSQSYGGSCWIFIATCPCRPRVGIPNEKPHDITYYCRFFYFLSFILETDLVTVGWVIVRSLHFLKTRLFLEMQSFSFLGLYCKL